MRNYFIERDNGDIVSLFACPQYKDQEKLKETNKEIVAFLKKQNEPTEADLNEQKIQAKMRQMAIKELKADNELPNDFE